LTLHVGQSWDQFPVHTEELFKSIFNKGSCKTSGNDHQKESEKMIEMNLAMNLDSFDHNLVTIDQLVTKASPPKEEYSTAEQFKFLPS